MDEFVAALEQKNVGKKSVVSASQTRSTGEESNGVGDPETTTVGDEKEARE